MDSIEEIKKELEYYKNLFAAAENNIALKGYMVLVEMLKQQNEYLDSIQIKSLIVSEEKSKLNEYERAKALWEGLPKMIQSVNTLKFELNIKYDPLDGKPKPKATTPQSLMTRN